MTINVVLRMDSIEAMEAVFTRTDLVNMGAWIIEPDGSSHTGGTGPGFNSEGPYILCEASNGTQAQIITNSQLTVRDEVFDLWGGNNRVLALRASIQGNGWLDHGEGLEVQGHTGDDAYTRIALLEGWAFSSLYTVGQIVTDTAGDTQTIVQNGGWVDFEIAIPDDYTAVRIRNSPLVALGENAYEHDIGIWQLEFLSPELVYLGESSAFLPGVAVTITLDLLDPPALEFVDVGKALPTIAVQAAVKAPGAFEPTDETIQDLIAAVVAAGSLAGISGADIRRFWNERVIDSYDNAPAPDKTGVYASILRLRPAQEQGIGQRIYRESIGTTLDAESWVTVAGTWSIQWHTYESGPSPFDYAHRFRIWCRSAAGLEHMKAHNLNFLRCSPVRDLSMRTPEGIWERRAGCDLEVHYRQRLIQQISSIGEVSIHFRSDDAQTEADLIFTDDPTAVEIDRYATGVAPA